MALDLAVQAQNLSKVTLLRDKCIKHFLSPSPSPLPSSSSSSSPLPSSIPPPEIPQRISDFFTGKIIAIRNNLDSQTVPLSKVNHHRLSGTPLTDFRPVSELISGKKEEKKTLHRSPLSKPVNCLDDLLPYFSAIINESLLSGNFPSIFKSAIVWPLLKKSIPWPWNPEKLQTRLQSNKSFKVHRKNRSSPTFWTPWKW